MEELESASMSGLGIFYIDEVSPEDVDEANEVGAAFIAATHRAAYDEQARRLEQEIIQFLNRPPTKPVEEDKPAKKNGENFLC